jgi:hypothetical protein
MTEQRMESSIAKVTELHERMMAEIRTYQLTMREKMGSIQEEIIAKMDASMKAWRKETTAYLERKEPTPEEMAKHSLRRRMAVCLWAIRDKQP